MRESNGKLNNSGKLAVLVIAILFAVAVIGVAANMIYQKTGFRGTYNKAVKLVMDLKYSEAQELFQSIEEHHYKDTDAFLVYCESADKYYHGGDYSYGHAHLDQLNFEYLTDEQSALVEELKSDITRAYNREHKPSNSGGLHYSVKPSANSETQTSKEQPTTKQPSSKKDPYGANEFAHPDDFYYDHVDDFWDYEEAEDYYYEHN